MDVNSMLPLEITKVGYMLLPDNVEINTPKGRLVSNKLSEIVDRLGRHSAVAQGLTRVVTSADKLRLCPSYILYLLKDANGNNGKGEVIGLLKIGRKHLYLADPKGQTLEIEPMCVLDFFVEPDYQRNGLGKKLFDHMLADMNIPVHHLAVDGPSLTMLKFLAKTYGLDNLTRHANNFAVAPSFYDNITTIRESACSTPADGLSHGASRFSAPQPRSAIASVIHGTVISPSISVKETREEVKAQVTPAVEEDEEEFLQIEEEVPQMEELVDEGPEPDAVADARAAAERPCTLHVETPAAPDSAAPSPAGSVTSRRDSQLTDKGFFDVKFYHNKLCKPPTRSLIERIIQGSPTLPCDPYLTPARKTPTPFNSQGSAAARAIQGSPITYIRDPFLTPTRRRPMPFSALGHSSAAARIIHGSPTIRSATEAQ